MARNTSPKVIAAIDVGTNAVRLKLARILPDGSIESLHDERDPVRPGEGVFTSRVMRREVVDRLLATLRRYAALCRRHHARVRAVATSAIREARNQDEILARVRRECGFPLEVVSGTEEARLMGLGVLRGKPARQRSVLIDVGGGSTEVAVAVGEKPRHLWSIALGAVRLSETFKTSGAMSRKQIGTMRKYAAEVVAESLPARIVGVPRVALGSSGSVRAVVGYAASTGDGHATRKRLAQIVKEVAAMTLEERRQFFDPRRADVIVAGAVIVEALARRLKVESVTAVPSGLRDGILVDLARRNGGAGSDGDLMSSALSLGRGFALDEKHARQVSRLAVDLFDGLAAIHRLPAAMRPLLEVAAFLHDIGHAVNYQKHHRHTHYLIINADIPGLADHQRAIVACVARYHRGSPPEAGHHAMAGLGPTEVGQVRKLAALLRLADSFDRSHHQLVEKVRTRTDRQAVEIRLISPRPLDLEIWDAERESRLFSRIFRKRLQVLSGRR